MPVDPSSHSDEGEETIARIRSFRSPSIISDRFILACTRASLNAQPPLIDVALLEVTSSSPVEDIQETLTINERGFDPMAVEIPADVAEQFRPNLVGGSAIIARWQGIGVSTGMWLPISRGVTELAGIATLVEFRRRGFGLMTVVALASSALLMGADLLFLSTNDEVAHSVYHRAGFFDVSPGPGATK
ncbi:MAG TPA: GNAT family N-acetyltransferase [Acidimicrobiales bacterium]